MNRQTKLSVTCGQIFKIAGFVLLSGFFVSGNVFAESKPGTQQDSGNIQVSQNPAIRTADEDAFFDDDWNPFEEMERMHHHLNRFFNQNMKRWQSATKSSTFQPDMDVQEKEDAYFVRMDLPGMQKDQIQIDVTDKTLTISGERRVQSEEEDVRQGYYRMERSFGSFHRTIPLETEIKTEEVTAKYENGVLEVRLPKAASQKPSSKSVKIQ